MAARRGIKHYREGIHKRIVSYGIVTGYPLKHRYKRVSVIERLACFDYIRRLNMCKFKLGDKVRLNPRVPENQSFSHEELMRPRTIVAIRYDAKKQCCYYTLGNNGKGLRFKLTGNPVKGWQDYYFRSYMIIKYEPRKYGKRRYRMSANDKRLQSKTS